MSTIAKHAVLPSIFLCHGGGPMPLLGHPSQTELVTKWKEHTQELYTGEQEGADGTWELRKPKAIVVVSGHYETSKKVAIGAAAKPKMLFDYYGFPAESYKYNYAAPGEPELAQRIASLLDKAGIANELDETRAFDHGVFVPLMKMFPEGDIPVVPLSVLSSQDAAEHIAIGRALAPLREEGGILFLGSGSATHNFGARSRDGSALGVAFSDHLTKVIEDAALGDAERTAELSKYLSFPKAIEAVAPGAAEHLTPLFTVLGTGSAGKPGKEVANIRMMEWNERHYIFE